MLPASKNRQNFWNFNSKTLAVLRLSNVHNSHVSRRKWISSTWYSSWAWEFWPCRDWSFQKYVQSSLDCPAEFNCAESTIMSFFSNTNTSTTAVEKDIEVVDPPTESISSLSFSSQADYLAVGSWDNSVRASYPRVNKQIFDLCIFRFVSMKLVQMDRHKGKQCTNTKDPCWTFAGTRYKTIAIHSLVWLTVMYRKVIKSSQGVLTMQVACSM